jgi:hypothetical protein
VFLGQPSQIQFCSLPVKHFTFAPCLMRSIAFQNPLACGRSPVEMQASCACTLVPTSSQASAQLFKYVYMAKSVSPTGIVKVLIIHLIAQDIGREAVHRP